MVLSIIMATAQPKKKPAKPTQVVAQPPDEKIPWILRLFDAVFRFLSSLKLAVMLLLSLAVVLAYGTFYESAHGAQAVALDIYQSKWFALLMAMLGVNILCAALIRFPWKRRQTGFVITHSGLIILLIGSFMSIKMTDEGEVYINEGKSSHTYVRENYPVVRVDTLDQNMRATGQPFVLPFRPGASAWESEKREALTRDPGYIWRAWAAKSAVGVAAFLLLLAGAAIWWRWPAWVNRPLGALVLALFVSGGALVLALAWSMPVGPRRDELTEPRDGFRLVVKDYIPAATPPKLRYEPAADGIPLMRAALLFKPPNAPEPTDAWRGEGWFPTTPTLKHASRGGSPLDFHYQVLSGPRGAEALADFLDIPANPLSDHRLRFHYADNSGKPRVFDWLLTPEEAHQPLTQGKTVGKRQLPDSALEVTLNGVSRFPTSGIRQLDAISPELAHLLEEISEATGQDSVTVALLQIREDNGSPENYFAWADLPLAPNALSAAGKPEHGQVRIDFYEPPEFAASGPNQMAGVLGRVDVVQGPDRRLYHRVLGREGLRGLGPIKVGETVGAFAGEGRAMQVLFRVDEVLDSGIAREVCEVEDMPAKFRKDASSPAALVELTADGVSREQWLFHARQQGPEPKLVPTRNGYYQLSLDYDKRDLGFDVHLIDFEAQFDPGSSSRSTYRSDVTVGPREKPLPPTVSFAQLDDNRYFQFVERPRESFRKLSDSTYEPLDGGEVITVDKPESVVQPSDTPTKIYMNNPMQHDGWTFFQSSFRPVRDPRTREETGDQTTILSIRYDPAWPVIYGGIGMVLLGTFVQFYMRAGVFTDGGKKERERAERKQAKQAAARAEQLAPAEEDEEL